MKYQIHNLTTLTDSWCGDYTTKKAADDARDTLAKAWPKNQYVVKSLLLFAVTYETISEESSQNGDVESSGFIAADGTETPALIGEPTLGVYMPFRQAMALFDQEREYHHIESDGDIRYPHVPGNKPRWFIDYGQIGASWGDVRNVTLHLPENITVSSAMRIARLLGVVS